jgi:hypothetical protein
MSRTSVLSPYQGIADTFVQLFALGVSGLIMSRDVVGIAWPRRRRRHIKILMLLN